MITISAAVPSRRATSTGQIADVGARHRLGCEAEGQIRGVLHRHLGNERTSAEGVPLPRPAFSRITFSASRTAVRVSDWSVMTFVGSTRTYASFTALALVSSRVRSLIGTRRLTVPSAPSSRPWCTASRADSAASIEWLLPPRLAARWSHSSIGMITAAAGGVTGASRRPSSPTTTGGGCLIVPAVPDDSVRFARRNFTAATRVRPSSGRSWMVWRTSARSACRRVRDLGRG